MISPPPPTLSYINNSSAQKDGEGKPDSNTFDVPLFSIIIISLFTVIFWTFFSTDSRLSFTTSKKMKCHRWASPQNWLTPALFVMMWRHCWIYSVLYFFLIFHVEGDVTDNFFYFPTENRKKSKQDFSPTFLWVLRSNTQKTQLE
jgi:hypothetical protein